ncbi:MAG: hypothetical protein QF535_12900, partial [Anaerolineales bacterium]|nr:hypothetical protein [Anaerolineales bacterium]
MATTTINQIEIKNRSITGGIPSITGGEIAINRADGNLWYNNDSDSATKAYLPLQGVNTTNSPTFAGLTLTGAFA